MPTASPSVEPTGTPTSTLWALQKEAIKQGTYVAESGPNYGFIRDIALGVAGFIALVVLSICSRRTYKKYKSGGSRRRERSSSRGRSRRHRSSRGRGSSRARRSRSRHDDYVADEGESTYTPDYTNTFSHKESADDDSQSYQYSLEDGIASPKSIRRDNRRDHQPSEADSSAFSSEFDDVESNVVDQMTRTVASFITEKTPKRVRREVFAPAGKLGIIVDTSSDGPVVHSIKGDSPLVGKVFIGDYIIAVDDEDTSDWSAHYVTKLVARKSGSVRKLTLMSNNWDDP